MPRRIATGRSEWTSATPHRTPCRSTLLTGFLGSGKTTLLRRALARPAFSDTAVIINEIGEIAIDHYLVDFVEGRCSSCRAAACAAPCARIWRETLRNLIERRDAGEIRPFRRIVVETSGLADPAPILFTLGTDPMLDQRLRLARVVTLVDAVNGADTLDRFAEAARQAAVADALVISKTDLAPFGRTLARRLDALNPGAERIVGAAASDPAAVLFGRTVPAPTLPRQRGRGQAAADRRRRGRAWSAGVSRPTHTHGIARFAVDPRRRDQPPRFRPRARRAGAGPRQRPAAGQGASSRFADRPDRPAVVQAAQHAMFTPEWLDAWPDADHRSRLVFIVHDIAPDEILARFAFAAPRSSDRGRPPARVHAHGRATTHRGGSTCSTPSSPAALAVLPSGAEPADIGVQGEKIAAIGAPGSLAALGAGRVDRRRRARSSSPAASTRMSIATGRCRCPDGEAKLTEPASRVSQAGAVRRHHDDDRLRAGRGRR